MARGWHAPILQGASQPRYFRSDPAISRVRWPGGSVPFDHAVDAAAAVHRLNAMLGAKPTVFVSHSEKFKKSVALPFRDFAESLGMNVVLVSDMPTPEHGGAEPDAKVDYYLDRADMFVALMTPDDRTESGEVHARPNITDEITRARTRSHLRTRVQVFKGSDVDLHSNINPTYEALDLSNVETIFPIFERQARAWEILAPDVPVEPESAVGPIGPSDSPGPELRGIPKGALGQVADAVEGFKATLLGEQPTPPDNPMSSIARAHLSASVALAAQRSTSPFGVHELNGLFRERALLELTSDEERFLLRAVLLHSKSENAPGWYWSRRRSPAALHRFVIDLALQDPDDSVRTHALRMLADFPKVVTRHDLKKLVEAGISSDETGSVQDAALDLLARRGDTRLIHELGEAIDTAKATSALFLVRARHAPVTCLRELLKKPSMYSAEIESALLAKARKLPVTQLRKGLQSDRPAIRGLCVKALDRSSRLRKEDALALIESELPSRERIDALKIALKRGWKLDGSLVEATIQDADLGFGEDDELRLAFHSRRTMEELTQDLKWIGGSSWTVYAALGLSHFDDFADQIRNDLDSDFKVLREDYRRTVEKAAQKSVAEKVQKLPASEQPELHVVEALVAEEVDDFFDGFESLESFTIKRFQIAAVRALAAHGNTADASYARRLIQVGDRELTNECVSLLARVGDGEDATLLVETAEKELHFDDAVNAAHAALTVSGDAVETVNALIASRSPRIIRAAVSGLDDSPLDEVTPIILPLLQSKNAEIRGISVDYLTRRLDRTQQEKLVDLYIEHGDYYYYNVVSRLDRSLYAPGWFKVESR